MENKTYISTSVPYVNGRPHIGFALELVQADVVARYHRLLGKEVHFQTGTDENALKNVLSAREEGLTPLAFVTRNSKAFQDLCRSLNISADRFVRTSKEHHGRAVHRLWKGFRPEDIYLKSYEGLYCVGCEDFYLEKELVNGRCPDHGTAPTRVRENNYFFRLSAYQDRLDELLDSDTITIIPERRKNEILSFIRGGLRDISVSRPESRSGGWGIKVPTDPSQTVYVWTDALTNYISGLGYGDKPDWSAFWNEDTDVIHVIGKNVWKFHAIHWPAYLISAGLPLPNKILVHGFVTENGQKISKSRGSSIDPFAYIAEYGTDTIRYYLLGAISPFEDGDFSTERFRSLYNTDLANGLGNLVSRIASLCSKGKYGRYHLVDLPGAPEGYHEALGAYEFNKCLKILWAEITRLNQDIDRRQPWKALKAGNSDTLKRQLTEWLSKIETVAYWLAPFLPDTSDKILQILSSESITFGDPLFPRAVEC